MSAPDQARLDSHWRILKPSTYLGAHDLKGRDAHVCIASVEKLELNREGTDDTEEEVVIGFKGKSKKWVANKTNMKHIATYLGTPYAADWIGKFIWLHPTAKEWKPATKRQAAGWNGRPIRNPQENTVGEAVRVWPVEPPTSKPMQKTAEAPSDRPDLATEAAALAAHLDDQEPNE